MKKFYTLSVLAVMAAGAFAQDAIQITTPQEVRNNGGQQAMAISANGKYVVGSSYQWDLFIYNAETKENKYFTKNDGVAGSEQGSPNFLSVSNDGVAVGFDGNGAVMIDFNTGRYDVVEKASKSYPYVDATGITPDGSIIIGHLTNSTYYPFPVYWTGGKRYELPYPNKQEAGFSVYGATADFISEDGSVIVGRLINGLDPYPIIVWKRQANGTYAYTDAFKKFYEPKHDIIWGPDQLPTGIDRGPNPYIRFSPGGLSGNGKYVAMTLVPNTDEIDPNWQVGYYDLETETVTPVPYDDEDVIAEQGYRFTIGGISNEGTIVGTAGEIQTFYTPYIIYRDRMKVERLIDAFPDVVVLQEFNDMNVDDLMWELATGITPNGRYIIGYISDPDEYAARSFLLDTGYDSGVDTVEAAKPEYAPAYYTIDGKRIANPDRGLYIKVAGEKAEKVIL